MTTQQASALGYIIAGLIFLPLTAMAKAGIWAPLVVGVIIAFLSCVAIRIGTGSWP